MRRNFSEKIHTGGRDTVAKAIRLCVLPRADHRIGIDVDSQNACCAGASSRKRQDARPCADIRDAFASQVQPADILGKILAAEEKAWMEYRRSYTKAKARRPGDSDASAVENQMVGKEKDEAMHKTAEWPVRRS